MVDLGSDAVDDVDVRSNKIVDGQLIDALLVNIFGLLVTVRRLPSLLFVLFELQVFVYQLEQLFLRKILLFVALLYSWVLLSLLILVISLRKLLESLSLIVLLVGSLCPTQVARVLLGLLEPIGLFERRLYCLVPQKLRRK